MSVELLDACAVIVGERPAHRRVRTLPLYDVADDCGHWNADDQDEPRALDEGAMSDAEYWQCHGTDSWGEVVLCFVRPPVMVAHSWCPVDREWEDGEIERACRRLQTRGGAVVSR